MGRRPMRLGSAGSMRQAFLWAFLPMLVLFLIVPSVGDAQVVTNITPSPLPACSSCGLESGPTTVSPVALAPLPGNTYNITGGARPGNGPNLFHSFGRFDVGGGDIANFQNTQVNGAFPATSNILSRVTGGNPSQIYGTIRTTDFGSANLFLMNPAGVLFGPTAVLDLGAVSGSAARVPGGSFYATTADYLNLGDTNLFYATDADPANVSVLSVAPVVAFGFLGPNAASIAIQGGNLAVPDGQTLSFIGGPGVFTPDTGVTVLSGVTMTAGRLSAPNGLIYMETVTAPGEIPLPTLSGSPLGSPFSFPGSENAVIYVQSGELVMKGASLLTTTTGPTSGEPIGINVEVAGQFTMQNGSTLSSSTTGVGQAGAINVSASTLTMDGASITSATTGAGSGGNISITGAQSISLTNGAQIVSSTSGAGAGGNITLSANDTVSISGFDGTGTLNGVTIGVLFDPFITSGVFSTASGSGNGGLISITAPTVSLSNAGTIATVNSGGGVPNQTGGNVDVAGNLQMAGAFLQSTTSGNGSGGNITTSGDTVSLLDGAQIVSSTTGGGDGGNITIATTNTLDSSVTISGADFTFTLNGIDPLGIGIVPSGVFTTASAGGNGGQISITAPVITVDNIGTIGTINTGNPVSIVPTEGGTPTQKAQKGGDVVLNGGTISFLSFGTLLSSNGGTGDGGNLFLQGLNGSGSAAESIMLDGAFVFSQTSGPGHGGNLQVTVNNLTIADSIGGTGSGIFIGTDGEGAGGNVTIQGTNDPGSAANFVTLSGGTKIASATNGSGAGEKISIAATSLELSEASSISSSTSGTGPNGNIVLSVQDASLSGGAQITSLTAFSGKNAPAGGNLTVQGLDGEGSKANSLTLTGLGSSISSGTVGSGTPGDILLKAKTVSLMDNAQIEAGSSLGNGTGGNVTIDADLVDVTNGSRIASRAFSLDSGNVSITAGELTLDNGSITTSTTSPTGHLGGDVVLIVGQVSLANGSSITSSASGSGQAGNINILASASGSVTMTNVSSITASTSGTGNAGQVILTTPTLSLDNGTITTSTSSSGNAGGITANVGTLTLTNDAKISSSSTGTTATGAAGSVIIQGLALASLADAVTLTNSSLRTSADSTGRGGSITIDATNLTLTNTTISASVKNVNAADVTDGPTSGLGDIKLTSSTMNMTGSTVTAETSGARNAGTITLTTTDNTGNTVNVGGGSITSSTNSSGDAGQVIVTTPTLSLDNGTITTSTSSSGNAGGITANVGTLTLTNKAEISSNSKTNVPSGKVASGNAGTVTVQGPGGDGTSATSVTLTNSSLLTNTDGTGAGGEIQIRAGQVTLADLAKLTAETFGTGKAGSIKVTSDNLSVTGGARIEASTAGVGDAGDITITNSDTVSVTGLSSNGSTRSGIFAKTQSSGGITGGGSGGGGGQTSTAGDAGKIDLTTKNLFLSNGAQIDSSTTTSGSGGKVSVTADAITITGTSTSLRSDASRGNGAGGDIELVARTIGIHDKASVTAATDGSGKAGNISMTANESFTLDSAAIITSSTRGAGDGGTIFINSPQVLVDGLGTSITASTLRPFADLAVTLNILHPNDGDLTVRLDSPDGTRVALLSRVGGSNDNFTVTTFYDLATQPITSGKAPFNGTFIPREPLGQLVNQTVAGTWKLTVTDQVGGNTGSQPQILQSWSLQVGHQVFQSTNIPLTIPDNGSVSSSLVVAGPAGAVVQGLGEVPGKGGDVTINAGTVTVQNGATLSATTRGSGQGGTVNVNATGPITLAGPGTGLFTDSEASGGSGNIRVTASSMTMDNGAKISAASSGTGNAGSITAKVGTLTLTNAAEISSSSTGTMSDAGDAGSVTINASGSFTSNGSKVSTSAENAKGGDILINAQSVQLSNGTLISASSNAPFSPGGEGDAGNITIHSGSTFVMENSKVSTEASDASGGTIEITAPEMVRLINSRVSTSVGGLAGESDGGNIKIDPQFVVLQNSQILAQAFAGAGGAITITATSAFIADPASIVDASSTLGINGPVFINSPLQNVGGRLTPLSQKFSSAAALLAQRCAARAADGKFSTFVVAGREGLPVEPGGFLASPSLTAELLGSSLSGRDRQTQFPAVTGLFQEYDARPIQLAMFGNACR